jgi:hypothetical protein
MLALYIGWRQWHTNHLKLRLELFDKRLVIFNATVTLISRVVQAAKIEHFDVLTEFLYDTRQTKFLFGDEIVQYLDTVYNKAADLYGQNNAAPEQWTERTALIVWFANELHSAQGKFGKYLEFTRP